MMKSETDYLERVFQKKDNIVARKIADEMILVPIKGNLADMQHIFSLTLVAEFIWERLDGEKPLKDIQDDVIQAFDVEEERLSGDLIELIDQMIDCELIMETPDGMQ